MSRVAGELQICETRNHVHRACEGQKPTFGRASRPLHGPGFRFLKDRDPPPRQPRPRTSGRSGTYWLAARCIEPTHISRAFHMHRGDPTALFAAGANETVIRTMGRWSSDLHRLYVRESLVNIFGNGPSAWWPRAAPPHGSGGAHSGSCSRTSRAHSDRGVPTTDTESSSGAPRTGAQITLRR